jgi:hypothetical protein
VELKFERIEPDGDRRVTITLQYRGLGGETYATDIAINCEGGMPGYPEPIIEDVRVHAAAAPGSAERAWLLETETP